MDIEELIDQHHATLYRYAYRLTGRVEDAEDLTQQVFLLAQQKLHQIRDYSKSRSWLFAVLRTCFLKNCRKRVETPATGMAMEIDDIPQDVPGGDGIDRERLQQAINELPETFRLVLLMYYFEECSYKEIAAQLEIEIGTVMSRLSRAKARLRYQLIPHRTTVWGTERGLMSLSTDETTLR
ncbi:MAG: sigma-70 family RNA polymerase sigma factor [Planctomycetota bacterium]|nr:sigma-70 family RNA polymerase sigma factor [Planctomycetota bacterium]